jgi:hypothetical protein
MKWVLVNRTDEIVDRVEMGSFIGEKAPKQYFIKRKQIDEKSFDKLWRVMSETKWDTLRELSNRDGKQYEWWKDEPKGPDDGIDY